MIEYLTKAIVLTKEPAGETDARVSVYTQDLGKIELVAKGLKKITSKFGHHLEPLNLIDCLVMKNHNYHLKGVLSENNFFNIKKNIFALETALKSLKMMDKSLIMPEKDEVLWRKLNGFLEVLNDLSKENDELKIKVAGIYFLARLSRQLGFLPKEKDLKKEEKEALFEILDKPIFSKIDFSLFEKLNLRVIEKRLVEGLENIY